MICVEDRLLAIITLFFILMSRSVYSWEKIDLFKQCNKDILKRLTRNFYFSCKTSERKNTFTFHVMKIQSYRGYLLFNMIFIINVLLSINKLINF